MAKNDRDLISALAEDYLNIYLVRPEDDIMDVIKLDGYVTDGIEGTWEGLNYTKILYNYTRNRVHPDDRDIFMSKCGRQYVIDSLSERKSFVGTYRVHTEEEKSYYSYKFAKVSKDGEPIRAVAAFRRIEDPIENKKWDDLDRIKQIMATSEMGTWVITLVDGEQPRMLADTKMKELLGIDTKVDISEEKVYNIWHSRIAPEALDSVNKSVQTMMRGHKSENTYSWIHPMLGPRYVRCGGTAQPISGGYVLSGYHYDVTGQVKKEKRSQLIIESFANSYEFINYIILKDGYFISYIEREHEYPELTKMLSTHDIDYALKYTWKNLIHEDFRDKMREFSNLATIHKRMEKCNLLTAQFMATNDMWYEWSYVVADRNSDGTVKHLIWAIRLIDDEKQNELRRERLLEYNIAANNAKTMFLQNMSHEIRTPLNAMFGFAQLLGLPDGSWSVDEKEMYNSYIFNSYNMLDMLIGDILDMADSEHGNYSISISEVNVNTVCRNAVMSVEYRKPGDVDLYYTSELSDEYTIHSDGRRIQQVLVNYLTNACKHTTRGEIHLHCSDTEHPGKLTFSVTDTGTGVPADKAEIIFNRFTKLDSFVQGSGLGLNICLLVAAKLGGEVYLDKSYTGGARFVFVIENA